MLLVNIQCDNAPERALHITEEEEEEEEESEFGSECNFQSDGPRREKTCTQIIVRI